MENEKTWEETQKDYKAKYKQNVKNKNKAPQTKQQNEKWQTYIQWIGRVS